MTLGVQLYRDGDTLHVSLAGKYSTAVLIENEVDEKFVEEVVEGIVEMLKLSLTEHLYRELLKREPPGE